MFPILDDILHQRYGFICTKSIHLDPPSSTLTELAIKISKGQASSVMSTTLCNTATAFPELLISGQPLNPDVCDILDGSLEKEYKSGHVTIERWQGIWIALNGDHTSCIVYLNPFSSSNILLVCDLPR